MPDTPSICIQSLTGDTDRWDLVTDFLRLRRAVFIEKLDWPLHHGEAMEYEQYDRADTVYLVAHEGDRVLGGARLLRTDRTSGAGRVRYSYMIRDAWLGLLDGLPPAICDAEPPTRPDVWELTRMVSTAGAAVAAAVLEASNAYLLEQGATSCLILGSPAFMRMARTRGYDLRPMGSVQGNRDGRFMAYDCAVLPRDVADVMAARG